MENRELFSSADKAGDRVRSSVAIGVFFKMKNSLKESLEDLPSGEAPDGHLRREAGG